MCIVLFFFIYSNNHLSFISCSMAWNPSFDFPLLLFLLLWIIKRPKLHTGLWEGYVFRLIGNRVSSFQLSLSLSAKSPIINSDDRFLSSPHLLIPESAFQSMTVLTTQLVCVCCRYSSRVLCAMTKRDCAALQETGYQHLGRRNWILHN